MFRPSILIACLGLLLTLATTLGAPSTPSVDRVSLNQAKRAAIVRRGTRTESALKRRASIMPGQTPYAVFVDTNASGRVPNAPTPDTSSGVTSNAECAALCTSFGSAKCTFTRYIIASNGNPSSCAFRSDPSSDTVLSEAGTTVSFKDMTCAEAAAALPRLQGRPCEIQYS